jgi:hypothetical protein
MQDRHARTVGGQSPKPAPILPSLPCSPIEEPADDPQGKCHTPAIANPIARLGRLRALMLVIVAIAPFMCEVTGSPVPDSSARVQRRRILKRSIGSPNSSRRRQAASPSRRVGSVL